MRRYIRIFFKSKWSFIYGIQCQNADTNERCLLIFPSHHWPVFVCTTDLHRVKNKCFFFALPLVDGCVCCIYVFESARDRRVRLAHNCYSFDKQNGWTHCARQQRRRWRPKILQGNTIFTILRSNWRNSFHEAMNNHDVIMWPTVGARSGKQSTRSN